MMSAPSDMPPAVVLAAHHALAFVKPNLLRIEAAGDGSLAL